LDISKEGIFKMSDKLTLYTNPASRGRIARWMLEEVGAPYETEILEFGGTMKGEDYLAINPMGKVPALKHGENIITETPAIITYLADAFPEAELGPKTNERADYYRWMFFAAGPVEAAMANHMLGVDVPADKRGTVGYGSKEQMLDVLAAAVSRNDYITGDRFTAADVYVGSEIGFGLQFGTMDARPEFTDYYGRLQSRDALQRALVMDNDLMAKK
jgi:glutathione S-transferase